MESSLTEPLQVLTLKNRRSVFIAQTHRPVQQKKSQEGKELEAAQTKPNEPEVKVLESRNLGMPA